MTEFKREVDCVYKDEHYSVRDNGEVLRHPRKGKRLGKYEPALRHVPQGMLK